MNEDDLGSNLIRTIVNTCYPDNKLFWWFDYLNYFVDEVKDFSIRTDSDYSNEFSILERSEHPDGLEGDTKCWMIFSWWPSDQREGKTYKLEWMYDSLQGYDFQAGRLIEVKAVRETIWRYEEI